MKLRSPLVYAGLTLALLSGLYVLGCSDDDETLGDQTGKQPPGEPQGANPGDGPGYTFAVSALYLGDTGWDGVKSSSAWGTFGYNLDHLVTTRDEASLAMVCTPLAGGAPLQVHPDGDGGVDNAFGKIIMKTIIGLAPDASTEINNTIAEGAFTIMFKIDDLGDSANYSPSLFTRLYGGTDMDQAPNWDGNDVWDVVPELLSDPNDITSSLVTFPEAYVNEHTWVSGTPGTLTLSLAIQGFELALEISQAIITMELEPNRSDGVTRGIIAGVLQTEPLIDELEKIAGTFDPGMCGGSSTFEQIADQIRRASDIMSDGTQNAGAHCDAISVGLGFEAEVVQLGAVGDPADPQPNPCDCANDTIDTYETCDGADLGGNDCTSIGEGFTDGTLACESDCRGWDTDGCTGGGAGGGGGGGAGGGGGGGGGG